MGPALTGELLAERGDLRRFLQRMHLPRQLASHLCSADLARSGSTGAQPVATARSNASCISRHSVHYRRPRAVRSKKAVALPVCRAPDAARGPRDAAESTPRVLPLSGCLADQHRSQPAPASDGRRFRSSPQSRQTSATDLGHRFAAGPHQVKRLWARAALGLQAV
jgi:hypothetical protein